MYRIVFDASKGGIIKSLISKQEGGHEYVNADSGRLFGEIRGYFYDEQRFRSSADTTARITVSGDDAFITTVCIEGHIGIHPFRQSVELRAGQRRIDFNLFIDWQDNPGIGEYRQVDGWSPNRRAFSDDRYKLNVVFPAALESPVLYKDAPFDVCESRLEDTFYNSWDGIKHNIILNWVDLAGSDGHGLALFTDHTTSYSYGPGFPLGLTLQYSGNGLWNRDYPAEKPLEVRYSIVPHPGLWDDSAVDKENAVWNQPLIAALYRDATHEDRSFLDTEGTGYEISAAIPVDEGIVLRLFNARGDGTQQKIRLGFPVTAIREIYFEDNSAADKTVSDIPGSNEMIVSMPRFGLRTYLIANRPLNE